MWTTSGRSLSRRSENSSSTGGGAVAVASPRHVEDVGENVDLMPLGERLGRSLGVQLGSGECIGYPWITWNMAVASHLAAGAMHHEGEVPRAEYGYYIIAINASSKADCRFIPSGDLPRNMKEDRALEYTIARSLRAARHCLEQALVSWEDHYTHPVMAELYREFAEICYDFTLAYLRHARYMGTQNATFSYAYEDLVEEKFEDKIDESMDRIRNPPFEAYRALMSRERPLVYACQVHISGVREMLDEIAGLLEEGLLSEES